MVDDLPMDPKERLLDAAEAVFAEYGFDGASLRAITAAAGANLAAVNYHFGSKAGLWRAVFARRVEPLNRERLDRLDAVEGAAAPGDPPLEHVLESFLRPPLRLCRSDQGSHVMRLAGRMFVEPEDRLTPIMALFDEVRVRFAAALQRALPDLPADELAWRMHFTIGVMSHTLLDRPRFTAPGVASTLDEDDVESVLARQIAYVAAGLRSPAPAEARR